MAWVRLDDCFWSNPKVIAAGNAAAGAYCRMLSYSANHRLDGHISDQPAAVVATKGQLRKLEELNMIQRTDGGWLIPDFLEFNPSRKQIENKRENARQRMRELRANRT